MLSTIEPKKRKLKKSNINTILLFMILICAVINMYLIISLSNQLIIQMEDGKTVGIRELLIAVFNNQQKLIDKSF